MKKVEAIIRVERLESVKRALREKGYNALTVYEARGRGEKAGIELEYRGHKIRVDLLPRIKLEIFARDEDVEDIVETIMEAAWTGQPGDGRIFVLPVEAAYRIRTREKMNTPGQGETGETR